MTASKDDLYAVGSTHVDPPTTFLWDFDKDALLEITELRDRYLVKATKAYFLLKQDEEGRETWNRKISELNDYLAETFPQYRLSIDYVNELDEDVLELKSDASNTVAEYEKVVSEIETIESQKSDLEKSLSVSLPEFEDTIENKLADLSRQESELETKRDQLVQQLEELNEAVHQWRNNGVMAAILFQFSTEPEITREESLEDTVEKHLEEAFEYHKTRIKQTLTGSNFRLVIEDVQHPRVLVRSEHSLLLNPNTLDRLSEQEPALEGTLQDIKGEYLKQFQPHALEDIETDKRVHQRSKSTPSQATSAILRQLETTNVATPSAEPPNSGPYIGTLAGSKQTVGFDPSEAGPHFYITGETGSGKSHTKRVLIENIASQDNSILSINPGDKQNIGLNLENPQNADGTGLRFNQYRGDTGDDLLPIPEDKTELFDGLNAVSLSGMSGNQKQNFIEGVFREANGLDLQHRTIFIVLDEAHNFNEGEAAEAIQDAVREGRKFGVNIILVSQSPKDFIYNYKKVRENTVNIFHRGEYFDYADKFIDKGEAISNLNKGQAVFPSSLDWDEFTVDIRDTLTRMWEKTPSQEEMKEVEKQFRKQTPDLASDDQSTDSPQNEISLTDDEKELLEFIKKYIEENDQAPTYSRCHREENSPFGTSKTRKLLDSLVDKNVIEENEETRYGNECNVYTINK